MINRRDTLKSIVIAGTGYAVTSKVWTTPVINAVILPAHAQTSENCSGFTTTPVNESISLTVSNTSVTGPIVANRSGNTFNQTETSNLGSCGDGDTLTIRVEFSGVIDSSSNSISGSINIIQTCGTEFVCEQISTYTASQSPTDVSDNGDYSGTLIGTLRCCDDF